MSLYEMVKDAASLAQKADNIELVRKLLDVQNLAIEMQEKQLFLNSKIEEQNGEIKNLKEMKRIVFAESENYLIDPAFPDRPLCPVCTRKFGYEIPMYNRSHCSTCKNNF